MATTPCLRGAARRRDRFDSLDQAYENYRSKAPLDQLHPDALRAYVEGGFAPAPDGSVTLRCRPSTEAEVFRHAAASGAWDSVGASLDIPVAVVAGRPEGLGPGAFALEPSPRPSHGACSSTGANLFHTLGHWRTLQERQRTWPSGSGHTPSVVTRK